MGFFLRIAKEVAQGAADYILQNDDPVRVEMFPALELVRIYPREVPRGSEDDPNGPQNAWDVGRWPSACKAAGDEGALDLFNDTGRMVALKNSEVWKELGNGAGGYDDCLGNPFPPFAFNSGMAVEEIGRREAIDLGLMTAKQQPKAARLDYAKMVSIPA